MAEQKKKGKANQAVGQKKEEKPWEKMYQGKKESGVDKAKTRKKPDEGKRGFSEKTDGGKPGNGKKTEGGKPENGKKTDGVKTDVKKKDGGKMGTGKKAMEETLDFLYLLPKKTSAKELAKCLTFLKKEDVEIWEEECVLEISAEHGTITFEDIRDSLEKGDEKVLSSLRMKQVLSCDYESSDRETVQKIMKAFVQKFGGKIGTDTEDFTPFLEPEEL